MLLGVDRRALRRQLDGCGQHVRRRHIGIPAAARPQPDDDLRRRRDPAQRALGRAVRLRRHPARHAADRRGALLRPGLSRTTTRTCSGATSPASRPARGRRWRRPGSDGRVWSRRRCRRASAPTSASPCRRWWSRARATNCCPTGWAAEIAEQIPNGRSAVIERAGHCPQIEQPDAVNELLLDFLGDVTRERTAS